MVVASEVFVQVGRVVVPEVLLGVLLLGELGLSCHEST